MLSSILLTSFLFGDANAHGRLTVPTTRLGNPDAYENNPIGFQGLSMNQYACRNARNPSVTKPEVTAGGTINVKWLITALHVGDAAVYISYDGDKPMSSIQDMEFFKIANIQSPKDINNQDYTINLPNWLPEGDAVLRWEWAATHVYPTIELYAQCSDIQITATDAALPLADIPKYKVVANEVPLTLPTYDSEGIMYNTFNGGAWFQTGPECALGETHNQCGNTAVGTTGWVDMFGSTTTSAAPGTTSAPTTTSATTTPATAPPASTTSTTPSGCVDDSRWAGAQCGGLDHTGSTCCPSGLACQDVNVYYSGCFEQCYGPSWACNTATTAPTTTTTTSTTQNAGCTVNRGSGAQCDGSSYADDESQRGCCAAGLQCYRQHQWYSGCYESCPTWAESCD